MTQNVRSQCQTAPTKNGSYLGLCGSNPHSERNWCTRNTSLFVVCMPSTRQTRHLVPRTNGHSVEPYRSLGGAQWGPTMGPPGSLGRKKNIFSIVVLRPVGRLKQVFLARFEPVVTHFGPWKIPKRVENRPFWGPKIGSKRHLCKKGPRLPGMLKQVFLPQFVPVVTCFDP